VPHHFDAYSALDAAAAALAGYRYEATGCPMKGFVRLLFHTKDTLAVRHIIRTVRPTVDTQMAMRRYHQMTSRCNHYKSSDEKDPRRNDECSAAIRGG
jgi:hypothetical protein